jgi:hypothetical protein
MSNQEYIKRVRSEHFEEVSEGMPLSHGSEFAGSDIDEFEEYEDEEEMMPS